MSMPKKPASAKKAPPPARRDGWESTLTGLGTSRDKRMHTTMRPVVMTREEAEAAWVGDFLVARVIEAPVEDMLRGGFSVNVSAIEAPDDAATREDEGLPPGFPPPTPKHVPGVVEVDDSNKRMGDLIDAALEDLGLVDHLEQALKDERALGGSAILIGAADGVQALDQPLNLDALQEVRFLTNFTAQDCIPADYYGDPREPKYGRPRTYQLQPLTMPSGYGPGAVAREKPFAGLLYVHESRLVIFPGIRTTRREALKRNGWGQSVVERVYEAVRDYRTGMQGASALVADFGQAVHKVKGLAEIYQSNDTEALRARFAGMDLARSMLRMLVIDSEEEFKREPTPVSGLPELLDRLATQVSAASEIPVTRLLGQAPAGLNATGASDIRAYYDAIESKRALKVRKAVERLVRLVMRAKNGPTEGVEPATWSVQFPPLWQPTAKERAEERKIVADTDKVYIDAGVLTPEEVAASRFSGDEWSAETVLDVEGRALVDAMPDPEPLPAPEPKPDDEEADETDENDPETDPEPEPTP
jgi:phage-related protein (TIGR01555 family)